MLTGVNSALTFAKNNISGQKAKDGVVDGPGPQELGARPTSFLLSQLVTGLEDYMVLNPPGEGSGASAGQRTLYIPSSLWSFLSYFFYIIEMIFHIKFRILIFSLYYTFPPYY